LVLVATAGGGPLAPACATGKRRERRCPECRTIDASLAHGTRGRLTMPRAAQTLPIGHSLV